MIDKILKELKNPDTKDYIEKLEVSQKEGMFYLKSRFGLEVCFSGKTLMDKKGRRELGLTLKVALVDLSEKIQNIADGF